MKLTLALPTDERLALRRLALERDVSLDQAAQIALRDWLIGHGYLELAPEIDEETETVGEA